MLYELILSHFRKLVQRQTNHSSISTPMTCWRSGYSGELWACSDTNYLGWITAVHRAPEICNRLLADQDANAVLLAVASWAITSSSAFGIFSILDYTCYIAVSTNNLLKSTSTSYFILPLNNQPHAPLVNEGWMRNQRRVVDRGVMQ